MGLTFSDLWDNLSADEQRALLSQLIDSLTVSQRDGVIHAYLKLKFLPEVRFDLPIVSSWSRRGGPGRRQKLTLRQLGFLKELSDGRSLEDIQIKWGVGRSNLLTLRKGLLRTLEVNTIEEAIEYSRQMLIDWEPYLRTHGRYGGSKHGQASPKPLTSPELRALKLSAAGWTEMEIAEEMGVPCTTIAGIRSRFREKLLARSIEEAVHRAIHTDIINPNEPSAQLLLKIYTEIASGAWKDLVTKGIIKKPSPLHLELLKDFADGVQLQVTAKQRGVSETAIVTGRQRMWGVVGGTNLRTALEEVARLGMIGKEEEVEKHAEKLESLG